MDGTPGGVTVDALIPAFEAWRIVRLGSREVIDAVVDRFGEFVLFEPRARGGNLVLWLAGPVMALLALLVTLPSLLAYNFLVAKIRSLIVRLDTFANELSGVLDRQFVDHRSPDETLPSLGEMGAPTMPGFTQPPPQSLTPPAKLATA